MTFDDLLRKARERARRSEECRLHTLLLQANAQVGPSSSFLVSGEVFTVDRGNWERHLDDVAAEAERRVLERILDLAVA